MDVVKKAVVSAYFRGIRKAATHSFRDVFDVDFLNRNLRKIDDVIASQIANGKADILHDSWVDEEHLGKFAQVAVGQVRGG